ncbi:hypothetical protein M8C21_031217 [Ambrosia artemisiifolia]|uniref:non-specific serine/threonine protein kinase n=1 Tax=Ambrosia artemisiifolia TaxID=4212 RepID=A0AAD5BKB2_AMBAR|nr:hypothetical protein M8C21_031217 [Ambrosia artemisiifolia]
MGIQLEIWVILIVVLSSIQDPVLVVSQNLACNIDDLTGLRAFMNGLESPIDGWRFTNSSSLSYSNNCCKWVGVTCSSSLGRIIKLDLPKKRLTGYLSDSVVYLAHLKSLNLSHNFLKGPVPVSLFRLVNLEVVDLSSNHFVGELPVTINLPALQVLDISDNLFNGSLPSGLCVNSTRIRDLRFAVNYFSGTIPLEFGNCDFLEHLCLASNYLSGDIPEFLFRLPRLRELALQDNSFSNLSSSLRILQHCPNLTVLILTMNFYGEQLPSNDDLQFKSLKALVIGNCRLTGSMPLWLNSSTQLQLLDLSWNDLRGTIPAYLGDFNSMFYLDLSNNSLSGEIPKSLTQLPSLISREISLEDPAPDFPFFKKRNTTGRGSIPPSLVKLSFLSKFSVAYNNLSGSVPSGGQFTTFTNTSYEGNQGLCGEGRAIYTCERTIPESTGGKPKKKIGKVVGMAIGICFGTLFLVGLMFMVVVRATGRQEVDPEIEDSFDDDEYNKKNDEFESQLVLFHNHSESISIDDVLKSTNSFDQSNIIGCGGFGLVFKATLPDNQKVAIKKLSGDCGQVDREFQAEVETLSRAQHPNLVLLQGYCKYKKERLLIYSFMENGSLDYWLHEKPDGRSRLDWTTRLRIAQGAIRGLAYLHQSCNPHILHRDIKSSNILLDENFEAHLADFGLARLILPYDTHVTTDLVGTLGYIPPEYGQASVASYKGDVYSYGVVLLELLTGRRPMDMCKPKGGRELISWVMQMKSENRETEVLDPCIFNKEQASEMLKVLQIACACLNESPKLRPSTQDLLSSLDNISLQTP